MARTARPSTGEERVTRTASGDTTEAAIWSRILQADQGTLSAPVAQAFLDLAFPPADLEHMRQLSAKAQEGTLTDQEQNEINCYEKVGHVISLMKLKARHSLKARRAGNGSPEAQ